MQVLSFPQLPSLLPHLALSTSDTDAAAQSTAAAAPEAVGIGLRWFTETFHQTLFGIHLWQAIAMAAALLIGLTR